MSVSVIGTVALDTIKTPKEEWKRVLGGSAVYAGVAASLFAPQVHLISIIGEDFPQEHLDFLHGRQLSTAGVTRHPGKSFHWEGYYEGAMNQAFTLNTELNVLLEFDPHVPDVAKLSKVVFLANIDPDLQLKALAQFSEPQVVILDSMNYWIETKLESLKKVIALADVVILNDQEIRLLTGLDNVVQAMPHILEWGARRVIVKKGEHGSVMFDGEDYFICPAFPLVELVDPTGAGDSFAGAIAGYLAAHGPSTEHFRKAMVAGTLTSSFTVRGGSLESLKRLTRENLNSHFAEFKRFVALPDIL